MKRAFVKGDALLPLSVGPFFCSAITGAVTSPVLPTQTYNTSNSTYDAPIVTRDLKYTIIPNRNSPFIWIIDNDTKTLVTPYVSNPGASTRGVAQSPDGNTLLVWMDGGNNLIYYTYPGFDWAVGPVVGGPVKFAAFSPDGTKIVVLTELTGQDRVMIFDVATGNDITPTWDNPSTSGSVSSVSWSNDGTLIALVGQTSGTNGVAVYNATTGDQLVRSNLASGTGRRCVFNSDDSVLCVVTSSQMQSGGLAFIDTSNWTVIPKTIPNYNSASISVAEWLNDRYLSFVMYTGSIGHMIYDYQEDEIVGVSGTLYYSSTTYQSGAGCIVPGGSVRSVSGNVVDVALDPVARTIKVYDSASEIFLGETVSDAITGDYEVIIFSPDPVYVIAVGEDGEQYKIASNIIPQPVD